ncbi:hypothetical protein, partial [Leptospira mayottensis]|uniref:hypothetical protein n=1 Tax=Leptospira mayottensis TaxID=1137606 RepID=UPI001AF02888
DVSLHIIPATFMPVHFCEPFSPVCTRNVLVSSQFSCPVLNWLFALSALPAFRGQLGEFFFASAKKNRALRSNLQRNISLFPYILK